MTAGDIAAGLYGICALLFTIVCVLAGIHFRLSEQVHALYRIEKALTKLNNKDDAE
jgi:hypothetical protein